MTAPDPSDALRGATSGNLCDGCNGSIYLGDVIRLYATYYAGPGWLIRRVWCDECGDAEIGTGTLRADEVTAEGLWWFGRIAQLEITDRSRPDQGVSPC